MPDPTLSQALKEAYASAPADEVHLVTLEFRHPDFTAPARVVDNTEDIVATLEATAPVNPGEAVTFTRCRFDLKPPEIDETGAGEVVIVVDNASREISEQMLLARDSDQKIECTMRVYLASDLSGPQQDPPITTVLVDAEVDVFRVTARATLANFSNRRFPHELYTTQRFPGLTR